MTPNEAHDGEVLQFSLSSNLSNAVSFGFPVPGGSVIPILQVRELRPREIRERAPPSQQ